MARSWVMLSFAATCGILMSIATTGNAQDNTRELPEPYKEASIKTGAALYDNWCKLSKFETSDNHPLYPAIGRQSGISTWRCNECHGWDYLGKGGHYKKGSHSTNIGGVYNARTNTPDKLYSTIAGAEKEHDFSKNLKKEDIWALVKFLREGQLDVTKAIDSNMKALGSAKKGRPLYEAQCTKCHGDDGNRRDFDKKLEGKQGVGWASRKNPQRSLHKIRWGLAGRSSPSMIADKKMSDGDTVHILSYCQTLAE